MSSCLITHCKIVRPYFHSYLWHWSLSLKEELNFLFSNLLSMNYEGNFSGMVESMCISPTSHLSASYIIVFWTFVALSAHFKPRAKISRTSFRIVVRATKCCAQLFFPRKTIDKIWKQTPGISFEMIMAPYADISKEKHGDSENAGRKRKNNKDFCIVKCPLCFSCDSLELSNEVNFSQITHLTDRISRNKCH